MLDPYATLLPAIAERRPLKVVSVCLDPTLGERAAEMDRLLSTLGVERTDQIGVQLRKVNPATYIGAGKVEEIRTVVESGKADAVVIDAELSPNQLRNLEKAVGKPTIDRPGVIIEIFSRNARTKEAKTQVELARLQYLLPRLAHYWTHFERQRGGVGQKGMGEKQIEVDRRLVKKRISTLKGRLKSIEEDRELQRASRKDVLKVALVGYTNAGKSTLLNALTQSHVKAEDRLFSTLDSSTRALDPHSHPPVVASDTVGFIDRLPTSLIASFRSTLEELQHADLLVHVVDASSPKARDQIQVTEKVLKELKLDSKPKMLVLNKIDQIQSQGSLNWARLAAPGATRLSALNQKEVISFREQIMEHFKQGLDLWEVLIPYEESKLESQLRAYGSVESLKHMPTGTFFKVRMSKEWADKLQLKRYRI